MSSPRVALIAVNYGATQRTRNLLASLARLSGLPELAVVIVDSASTPSSWESLQSMAVEYPGAIELVRAEHNVYYWGGAALALDRIRSSPAGLPAWVIISNNDVLIEQRDFLERLQRNDRPGIGVVAPAVVSGVHGGDQNPFLAHRPSTARHLIWRLYYAHYTVAWIMRRVWALLGRRARQRHRGDVPESGMAIYAPHGAFVCLRREYFERGGWLDTNFRLYGEENTLAESVRQLGLSVLYQPALEVIHDERGATGGPLTRSEYEASQEAYHYFRRAYLSRPRSATAA